VFSTSRAHELDLYLSFANKTTHEAKFINSTSEKFCEHAHWARCYQLLLKLSLNLLAKSKNKGDIIITRGMQLTRLPSLKMERYCGRTSWIKWPTCTHHCLQDLWSACTSSKWLKKSVGCPRRTPNHPHFISYRINMELPQHYNICYKNNLHQSAEDL
jgi:hypothetical protein